MKEDEIRKENVADEKQPEKVEEVETIFEEEEEYDPYEGYDRDNPPPWLDEFEYIDFMMTH